MKIILKRAYKLPNNSTIPKMVQSIGRQIDLAAVEHFIKQRKIGKIINIQLELIHFQEISKIFKTYKIMINKVAKQQAAQQV